MSLLRPTWRLSVKAVVAAAAMAVTMLNVLPAHSDTTVPPTLTDGYGLTQVGAATGTANNFVLTVTTAQVAGPLHIRIILPSDYGANPAKRYPVFYLLHGALDDPINPGNSYPALLASTSMITVMPDGGRRGWYTNWSDQNTAAGAQNWENFHIDQVIPFIDANLRTIATKHGRAIGGYSMGGLGAMHYAQGHPELFSQVASFSGAIDISADEMVIREAVVASLTNGVGLFCETNSCTFGPTVSSDAIWGTPYPVLGGDWKWNNADPSTHMNKLSGIGISIYTGEGSISLDESQLAEHFVWTAANQVTANLDTLSMPYYYQDYGNGSTWGSNCHGGHGGPEMACMAQDLVDYLPRLDSAFAS